MIFNFIKYQKFKKGQNGIDFSSKIDNAKKSMAKVMNHRIEKLSTLLDKNQSHLNMANITEIPIEFKSTINESSDNSSCSSPIKVEPLSIPESKKFKSNSSIKKHKCEKCKKRFKNSTHLNIHKRTHSKQKPFACDQCQMAFSQKSNLTTHKRTHSGVKPYQCDICKKNFTRSSGLTTHKRIHSGEKPYSCSSCHLKFSTLSALIVHKRIHTGEKPYQCSSCHKKFSDLSNFRRHKNCSNSIV
jgi:uncharacterized Zn-finger protein